MVMVKYVRRAWPWRSLRIWQTCGGRAQTKLAAKHREHETQFQGSASSVRQTSPAEALLEAILADRGLRRRPTVRSLTLETCHTRRDVHSGRAARRKLTFVVRFAATGTGRVQEYLLGCPVRTPIRPSLLPCAGRSADPTASCNSPAPGEVSLAEPATFQAFVEITLDSQHGHAVRSGRGRPDRADWLWILSPGRIPTEPWRHRGS